MRVGARAMVISLGLVLSQCDRAPAEPIATASAGPKTRCMQKTSDKAPPKATGPDPKCPKDPDGGPPTVPTGKITFSGGTNAPTADVELMLSDEHRERGLMYRTSMPDDHGMLFVFPDSDVRSFWMHNTCIPLDMLFVASDGFVTGVLESVPTMNDEARSVPCAAKYVLEMNAGYARAHGVKAGQSIKIDGVP
jgi:uncharacterized membrane protein (UPF0127 family)